MKIGPQNGAPGQQFYIDWKNSTSILLKFWWYFWLQDFRGSIYVCRNLPVSHLVQFKAWKWGFGWFLNLQVWKTWIFQISRLAHKVWWILGAPIWAPKSKKFYFHKLQKKLKIFQFYHVCSKCTSFYVQPQILKWYQIPYYGYGINFVFQWKLRFHTFQLCNGGPWGDLGRRYFIFNYVESYKFLFFLTYLKLP